MVNYAVEVLAKIACIGMMLFQGLMLDGYMVLFHNHLWWLWSIVDVLIILAWTILLVVVWRAYRSKEERRQASDDVVDGRDLKKFPDEIKHAYILWIVYSLCLIPRIIIIYQKDASKLLEEQILGPNFCKVATACTPLIFMLLVYALHDAKQIASRKYYLGSMIGSITLDLFDSSDLLNNLFAKDDQRFPREIFDCTLAFACINLFLPALALTELRLNRFNGQVESLSFKIVYECCYVCLVNIPNLVLRSILWHKYDADVSVLIMKNVMCICLGVSEIARYFTEERPKKCGKCNHWYESDFFNEHIAQCRALENTPLNQDL